MDLLQQTKLSRSEWQSVELPCSEAESKILDIISKGYSDTEKIDNHTKTMTSYTKISPSMEMHYFLYNKYFKPVINNITKYDEKAFHEFTISSHSIKKMKSADLIRIQNVDKTIEDNKNDIYEFQCLILCKDIVKSIVKKASHHKPFYTLLHWDTNHIENVNPHIVEFIAFVKKYAEKKTDKLDILHNATDIIEKNEKLYKYEDIKLFSHQKDLFTFCRANDNVPKFVLYTAPTGTGKTLSPIGLSMGNRIIFVCVARHVGLALAKSAISMKRKVAFAFGCETADDIRLHYFAAKDYEVNRRTGGIWKVDNSNGTDVQIMICDVQSYLCAMYYMLSFNEPHNIVTYWDEPTITLDYDEHPLHPIIKNNWNLNKIPNMILSCATLPKRDEIHCCVQDFVDRFPGTIVQEINSFDCRKSIPIINTQGCCFVPHVHCDSIEQVKIYSHSCEENKTLLRYFDLEELIRFIKYMHKKHPTLSERASHYFDSFTDITMHNIKLYYLHVLRYMTEEDFFDVKLVLPPTKKFNTNTQEGSSLRRVQSVQQTHHVSAEGMKRLNSDSTLENKTDLNALLEGILLTTKDAHTLSDGPTIYLADNVLNVAKFYVQQSKIPDFILNQLVHIIKNNDTLQDQIRTMEADIEKAIQVKDNSDKNNDKNEKKTVTREKRGDETVQVLKDNVSQLKRQLMTVSLHPVYIPNSNEHQEKWCGRSIGNAFRSDVDEKTVRRIMEMEINTNYKVLVLMGIGVLLKQECKEYEEIVKELATNQKLFLIITSSDFIYGTNYQFCHGFIGKDLLHMTKQKCLQAMGRVGRNKLQQNYSVRFRNDKMIHQLFDNHLDDKEAENMIKLLCSM